MSKKRDVINENVVIGLCADSMTFKVSDVTFERFDASKFMYDLPCEVQMKKVDGGYEVKIIPDDEVICFGKYKFSYVPEEAEDGMVYEPYDVEEKEAVPTVKEEIAEWFNVCWVSIGSLNSWELENVTLENPRYEIENWDKCPITTRESHWNKDFFKEQGFEFNTPQSIKRHEEKEQAEER